MKNTIVVHVRSYEALSIQQVGNMVTITAWLYFLGVTTVIFFEQFKICKLLIYKYDHISDKRWQHRSDNYMVNDTFREETSTSITMNYRLNGCKIQGLLLCRPKSILSCFLERFMIHGYSFQLFILSDSMCLQRFIKAGCI